MLKHEHLIIRAEILKPPLAHDIEFMNDWFKDLIESIGMKILLGPYTVYSEMVGNRGFTGICAIETSSVTMHVWDEDKPSLMQLDIFTCATLDCDIVMDKLKVFKPDKIEYLFIDREKELEVKFQDRFFCPLKEVA